MHYSEIIGGFFRVAVAHNNVGGRLEWNIKVFQTRQNEFE